MKVSNIKTNLFAVLFLMLRRWQFECPTHLWQKNSKQGGRVTNFSIPFYFLENSASLGPESCMLKFHSLIPYLLLHPRWTNGKGPCSWKKFQRTPPLAMPCCSCNGRKGFVGFIVRFYFFHGMWHPQEKERYRTSTMRFFDWTWYSHMFLTLPPC